MKTKLIITALMCTLSINAASADTTPTLGVTHTSDYYYRGAQLSADALQLNAGVGAEVGGYSLSFGFLTNQASEATNTDTLSLDLSKAIFDKKVTLAAGAYNMDTDGTPDHTQAYLSAAFSCALSPRVTLFRDTSDNLYTYELAASHTFDINIANLTLGGVVGRTELTSATERDYTVASARLSKSFENITPHVQVALVDSDTTSSATVVCLGIDIRF